MFIYTRSESINGVFKSNFQAYYDFGDGHGGQALFLAKPGPIA
jgi:hypothetical protein